MKMERVERRLEKYYIGEVERKLSGTVMSENREEVDSESRERKWC